MTKHRGEILKKVIEDSGIAKSKIIKETGIAKATFYALFDQIDPKLDYVVKIGKAIKHDFSKEFPELSNNQTSADENLTYMIKYMELLEKHLQVLEENAHYAKELNHKKK